MFADIINKHAIAHNLRPDVVACIVIQESKGNTFAWRWEEDFYHKHLEFKKPGQLAGFVPKGLPSFTDELLQRSCSFGPMQVLGDTARWCGKVTAPFLTALCDPDFGIDIGCRVLSYYLGLAKGDYRGGLKGYNGSWAYADEVLGRVSKGEHVKFLQA